MLVPFAQENDLNVVLNVLSLVVLIGGGALAVLLVGRWKATVGALEAALHAAQAELKIVKLRSDRLQEENIKLRARVGVLESRTDLTTLQAETREFHKELLLKIDDLVNGVKGT